jgi:hypothetical protein
LRSCEDMFPLCNRPCPWYAPMVRCGYISSIYLPTWFAFHLLYTGAIRSDGGWIQMVGEGRGSPMKISWLQPQPPDSDILPNTILDYQHSPLTTCELDDTWSIRVSLMKACGAPIHFIHTYVCPSWSHTSPTVVANLSPDKLVKYSISKMICASSTSLILVAVNGSVFRDSSPL